ncbi:GNAT family N-acetyltransferase [Pseudomonas nunensis]|uniref:GNAT family N-acetyltransferase n=1 Tax=Pseudomonas nunensis TaxID=2961896 RepID=A0ABY5EHC7_9PSED|nr:GNAT family N-acetyltransferase [Pseudomonas nunensis]KOY03640.1 GNAT family acetyltransferase [Pseudomonas nunensis]KPN93544.1 GNAT family acetyltransferase [Pseudomonas nunensis]MCL5228051.1 GNAT family N-acetyltransferase [Pseudomonas nunensis]UTO15064.1 GNAT family N-acetyltransferase [Pseudomonas nunensis]
MWIERLDASHALDYRELMLEAYDRHPQAFTSSVRERAAMPLGWWESRLTSKLDVVFGGFVEGKLSGIVGLAFEPREKARHKATLFGMYVSGQVRQCGLGFELVQAALTEAQNHPGLKLIQLTVTAGNDAAFKLYQRCGFIQFGLEPLAVRVGEDYFDKIHMWREI